MKDFTVEFNLSDSEYMTALRLAVGAVCTAADVDVESLEDMKVCVTESCLLLKSCGYQSVKVVLSTSGGFSAKVSGFGGSPKECDSGFSLALISALVTSLDIAKTCGVVSGLTLKL